jgi:hypothetical protein
MNKEEMITALLVLAVLYLTGAEVIEYVRQRHKKL